MSSHSDCDGMGSIPAIPNARNVPLLLCHERFNEASLLAKAKVVSSHSDSGGMGSIPASPDALNVPLLLCQERFDEASLSEPGRLVSLNRS